MISLTLCSSGEEGDETAGETNTHDVVHGGGGSLKRKDDGEDNGDDNDELRGKR